MVFWSRSFSLSVVIGLPLVSRSLTRILVARNRIGALSMLSVVLNEKKCIIFRWISYDRILKNEIAKLPAFSIRWARVRARVHIIEYMINTIRLCQLNYLSCSITHFVFIEEQHLLGILDFVLVFILQLRIEIRKIVVFTIWRIAFIQSNIAALLQIWCILIGILVILSSEVVRHQLRCASEWFRT